jgi:UDP-glucose 4-epimerase
MQVVVTGGSGFIGSHVVDKLKDQGIDVRIFDMVQPTVRDDVEYYQGSLLDPEALLMGFHEADAVFHLAAIADVSDVLKDPVRSEEINVRGTLNVLESARRAGVKRVILGSTIWVYSNVVEESVDEDTALPAPSHLYTATKLVSEYYCKSYSELYGLETTVLRYGIPYGPRAREAAVIPAFLKKALNGEPIEIQGDGSQTRRFIYVEDLAEGNVMALKPVAANRTYNLEGKDLITIHELATTIQDLVGDVDVRFTEGRPGDFSGKTVSSQRAKEELGWEPKVNMKEGLDRYLQWFKQTEKARQAKEDAVGDFLKS